MNVAAELGDTYDPTSEVFRFLSRATGLVGLLCVPLVFTAAEAERSTAIAYVAITLGLALTLALVRGRGAVGVPAPEPTR